MRKSYALLLGVVLLAPTPASFALDLDSISKSAQESLSGSSELSGEAEKLVKSLTGSMDITSEQATGGTAALLALAKNQLSNDQVSAISKQVPGLESFLGGEESNLTTTALKGITSMESVSKAFSALGLKPEMITQFTPQILAFLGDQGISDSILSLFKKAWA